MATLTNRKLTIMHDHEKRTAKVTVTCNVNFTKIEYCLMKSCESVKLFKLKCQLWGSDSGFFGADDYLYTFSSVRYYPDPSPTLVESAKFEVIVGEGLLDEDIGTDEIYGKLILTNLFNYTILKRNTNTVSHSF